MIDRFFTKLETLTERYMPDDKPTAKPDCEQNIICMCGRRNCLGSTLAFSTYHRKLKAIE